MLDALLQSFVFDSKRSKDFPCFLLHRMKRSQQVVIFIGLGREHHESVVVVARFHGLFWWCILRIRANLDDVVVLEDFDFSVPRISLRNNFGAVDEWVVAFVDIWMIMDRYHCGSRCGVAFQRILKFLYRNIVVLLGIGFNWLAGRFPDWQRRNWWSFSRPVAPERRLLPPCYDASSFIEWWRRWLGSLMQPFALQYLVDCWSLLRIMQQNAFWEGSD